MTATTTASQGSGPRYAPEDPTLPKPWKGLVDGSTGYLYYWNPVTNVTQYEKPVSEEQLPPPPPLPKLAPLSSVQVHQHHHDGDGRYRSHQYQGVRVSGERTGHGSTDVGLGSSGTHSHAHGAVHSRTSTRNHGSSDVGVSLSAEAYRRQHEITVSGDDVPAPYMTFESTGFPPEILKEVQRAGFSSPTPIQAQSWPITLQKRDVVAIAKTGSGKTIGYLFPGFVHLKRLHNNSKMGPTVLVLSPTRELATQIQDEAEKFGRSSRISCTCLYGGAPKGPQLRDLDRGVDIVVATPGRLNDILDMRRISLRQVSYLVLDEADRMLDMGFEPQIRKIVKDVPHHRQTLMFTATWPKEVRKIAADLLLNPVQVNIGSIDELVANKAITQYIEMLKPAEKQRRLEQILRSQETGSKVLIFCSTKRMCDQLARTLARQFVAVAIHGDKSQGDRDRVLSQFKNGRSPILVATDVAARGLDIKDIRVVINYDFPTGVEDYVHRIGRTGRAGATGVSYTFFCDNDSKYAWDLVKVLEGADQRVPPELRDMVARGGYGGKSRRWGSGSSIRDRGRAGHGDTINGGRSGRAISSSSRLDNGHDRNSYGRDRDTRDRNSRSDGRILDKKVHNDEKGILKGNEHSRSRSFSPSPRRGHGVLGSGRSRSKGLDNAHSRSRSRSRSIGRSNGRLVVARISGKSSPPPKRKETSVDHHHDGESPPRKRRDTLDDRHHGMSPQPKQELSSDRYRGTSPSKREISNDRHRGPSSPKRDLSIDRHQAPSPRSRSENLIDRHRRLSPSNLQSSHDDRGRTSLPKRDISIDRHRAPSPCSKSESLTDRHRRLSPPSNLQESAVDRGRTSPPKRDISFDRHRAPSPRPKCEILTDRHHKSSPPKRDISIDRYRALSPRPKCEILTDRQHKPSPPSNLQNSVDNRGRTSVQKNESLIERECASTRDARRPISRDDSPSPPRQRSRSPPYRQRMENGSRWGLASSEPLSLPPSLHNSEAEADRPKTPMYSGVIESEKFIPTMHHGVIESIPPMHHGVIESEKLIPPMYHGILESEKLLPPMYCGVIESGKLLEGGAIRPTSASENGEEDEEGLIPPENEEGIILPDPEHLTGSRDN